MARLPSNASTAFEEVLRWFSRHPGQVILIEKGDALRVDLSIRCHPEDAKRFVGRNGSTLEALSYVARALWNQEGKTAEIERGGVQDNGSEDPRPRTKWDEDWKEEFERGFFAMTKAVFPGMASIIWSVDNRQVEVCTMMVDVEPSRRRQMDALGLERLATFAALAHGQEIVVRVRTWEPETKAS